MQRCKKGDISTAFITIISVFMITIIFFQNIMLNLETEKYNILNQYARDALLICETQPEINKADLAKIRKTLAQKLCKKDKEYIDFKITVGNNETLITDTSTGVLKPLYGQEIKIVLTYQYRPFRLTTTGAGLLVKRTATTDAEMLQMGVSLATTSKARSGL